MDVREQVFDRSVETSGVDLRASSGNHFTGFRLRDSVDRQACLLGKLFLCPLLGPQRPELRRVESFHFLVVSRSCSCHASSLSPKLALQESARNYAECWVEA